MSPCTWNWAFLYPLTAFCIEKRRNYASELYFLMKFEEEKKSFPPTNKNGMSYYFIAAVNQTTAPTNN